MQESVSRRKLKNRKTINLKPVIFTILFFLLIFFIFSILVMSKKNNLCFEARKFYIVYADKNRYTNQLLQLQNDMKTFGGAGVVFFKDNEYYLAVNIYTKKDDASEIANDLSEIYQNVGVVEVSLKAISLKNRELFRANDYYFQLYNLIYNFPTNYENLCFNFIKGDISEGGFMSALLADKLALEKQIEYCKSTLVNELETILEYANLLIIHFNNIFSEFYSSVHKESLCYEFFVSFCLTYKDLCDNLK